MVHVSSNLVFLTSVSPANLSECGALATRRHTSQSCKQCSDAGSFFATYMLFSVGAFLAICFGVLYWRKSREIDERAEKMEHDLDEIGKRAKEKARDAFATSAMHVDTLLDHVRTVRKLCANKFSILVYTGQVVYQYASIVTGYEFDFHYPQPAKWVVEHMSLFGLSVLSLSSPECVNPRSNFYTRVLLATLGPLVVIATGISLFFGYNAYYNRREHNHEVWAYVLAFLEFVLSGVSTVVCKSFVCEEIEGEGTVLVEQPTILCVKLDGEKSGIRRWWEAYSAIMIVVYPIGVPLFILMLLYVQRKKIQRVMRVKKALKVSEIMGDARGEQELQDISDKDEKAHLTSLVRHFSEPANRDDNEDEVSIEKIAHRDSNSRARGNNTPFARNSRLAASQLRSSLALAVSNEREVSKVLLAMSHLFEKFEPDTYWYGVYLMTVRLLETSMLVFFKKRTTKASVAAAVAVTSLTISQKYKPWLIDSDDKARGLSRACACFIRSLFTCARAHRLRRSPRGFYLCGFSRSAPTTRSLACPISRGAPRSSSQACTSSFTRFTRATKTIQSCSET